MDNFVTVSGPTMIMDNFVTVSGPTMIMDNFVTVSGPTMIMDNFGATEAGIFITLSNLIKQLDLEVEVHFVLVYVNRMYI